MSKRAFARAFCASTALCGALAATPAIAQLAPPAPVRQSIDANGVDLFRGTYNVDAPVLIMGGETPQGLGYHRLNRGLGWSDNLIAALNLNGSVLTVSLGGVSDRFNKSGSTYTPIEGNGATLTFNSGTDIYTYTRADGTVIRFDRNYRSFAVTIYANEGRVIDITRPAGEKLTFNYSSMTYCASAKPGGSGYICTLHATAYRVASIRNSHGYRIGFGYGEIDPYDPTQPEVMPDLTTWSTAVSGTMSNLAAPSGSATISQSFAHISGSGVTTYNITDALGRTTKYRMNGSKIVGITRPGSTSEDVTIVNSSGLVTGVTTAAGTTSYARSDSGGVRTVTVTDPLSHVTTYTFDIASERMTSMTGAEGNTTAWQYDASGRMTRVTQDEGNYTHLTYDTRGNVTERRAVAKTPGTPADIVTSATYPSTCSNPKTCNQPLTTTDAMGNVTDYTYDAGHGGVLTVTAPAPSTGAVRPQTRYGYSTLQAYFRVSGSSITASGEPVTRLTSVSACRTLASCAGGADEVKTTIGYGPQTAGVGNNLLPVSVTRGAGDGSLVATTAYGYDVIGNRVTVDGPLAGAEDTVHARYDAGRQLEGTIAPDPDGAGVHVRAATRLTHDPRGRVTLAERGMVAGTSDTDWAAFAPAEAVAASYDAADRKLTETLASGGTTYRVTQYSYDGHRLDCVAVRMNPAAWGTLPASACTAQAAGADGADRITRTLYDDADRVVKVETAYGVTGEQADEVTTTWSANGKPLTLTDAEGNKTSYEYDGHDRLAKTRYPSPTTDGVSSATDYEAPTYDANGNVTSVRLRDGQSIALTYDKLDRVTAKNLPGSEPDVGYEYDLLGRVTEASQPGHALTFDHDALGRMTSATSPLGTTSYQYDLAGRRTRLTWPDAFHVTYDWNAANQLTHIRENGAASGAGVLASYAYDDLGRRVSVTRGNGTSTSYGYDAVSRLASLGQDLAGTTHDLTLGFTHNPASQIASNTRSNDLYAWGGHFNKDVAETPNGLNQATAQGTVSIGFDARGNMTSKGAAGYTYTSENLLTSGPGVSLVYDPAMRLYQLAGTRFLYDGQALIGEVDGSGALTKRHVHGPGTDEPIVEYAGPGTTSRTWLHADERGSIIARSNTSGAMTAINSYDEHGVPAATNAGRHQYTGQTWLPELQMYYYKARIYDPKLGRFVQADPIGYMAGMNLYNYVGGDPVNFIDPSGLRRIWGCVKVGDSEQCGWTGNDDTGNTAGDVYSGPPMDRHLPDRAAEGGNRGAVPQSGEERRRDDCAADAANGDTPIASTISSISSGVATLADGVAAVAVFVPGGQGVAVAAKLTSFAAQGIQAGANLYIGRTTGNYSALSSQGAGFAAGAVFGRAFSAGTAVAVRGTVSLSKGAASRFGALGDASGAVVGDGASNAYCGR